MIAPAGRLGGAEMSRRESQREGEKGRNHRKAKLAEEERDPRGDRHDDGQVSQDGGKLQEILRVRRWASPKESTSDGENSPIAPSGGPFFP
jgi:hypothetical protein